MRSMRESSIERVVAFENGIDRAYLKTGIEAMAKNF